MTTEHRCGRDEGGFTLIEVLIAMVILAIGLLGLEALGIGAARSVALADRQSEWATRAAASAEEALQEIRAHIASPGTQPLPEAYCQALNPDGPGDEQISRAISLADPNRPEVIVRVVPGSDDFASPRHPFEVRSSIFSPQAVNGPVSGAPCS